MASTETKTTTSDVGEDPNDSPSPSDALQQYYTYYCNRAPTTTVMNNSKFSKAIGDMGHFNKKFTRNDCDLVFTKVKAKGKRTIDFDGFLKGCQLIATKKYPKTGRTRLLAKFVEKSKALPSKKKKTKGDGVYDRLTDTSKYGGTYGERFDEDGKGKGLDGVDSDRTKGYKKEKGILDGATNDKVDNIKDILRPDN